MLSSLLGSKTLERVLFFLLINEKCYPTQLHRLLSTPLTPVQKGLAKLEGEGIVHSVYEGKTRFYRFNPQYPLKKELEQLLRKAYELLPIQEKRSYYAPENTYAQAPDLSYKKTQDTLLECWSRLKGVSRLQISARLLQDVSGKKGEGSVKVVEEGASVLFFRRAATGSWRTGRGSSSAIRCAGRSMSPAERSASNT